MEVSQITPDWLKQQQYILKKPNEITIDGVIMRDLTVQIDGRGDVIELFNQKWLSEGAIQPVHIYQSATDYGVIKCWHLHAKHTDQFTVTRGKLQVSMVDLREGSPTFLHVNTVILGTTKPRYIKIPFGIMHGWKALAMPETIVVNLQSHPYDPVDEFKYEWDTVLKEIWQPING